MIVYAKDLHLVVGLKLSPNTTFGCVRRNARKWFAARGWDWSAFVRDGRDIEDFRATNDAFALALVAAVEKAEAERGR